jgi:hypothetical protein
MVGGHRLRSCALATTTRSTARLPGSFLYIISNLRPKIFKANATFVPFSCYFFSTPMISSLKSTIVPLLTMPLPPPPSTHMGLVARSTYCTYVTLYYTFCTYVPTRLHPYIDINPYRTHHIVFHVAHISYLYRLVHHILFIVTNTIKYLNK